MTEATMEKIFGVPTRENSTKVLEFRRSIKKVSSDLEELFGIPVIDVTFTEWRKGDLSNVEPFLFEANLQQADFFSHESIVATFNFGNVLLQHSQRKMILGILQECGLNSYVGYTFEDVFGEIHFLVRFNL